MNSVIIVIVTDVPLSDLNLTGVASRAVLAFVRTGSPATNGSGDYSVAFSAAEAVRRGISDIPIYGPANQKTSTLFQATMEATEEAILNALFTANILEAQLGTIEAKNIDEVGTVIGGYGNDDKKNTSDD